MHGGFLAVIAALLFTAAPAVADVPAGNLIVDGGAESAASDGPTDVVPLPGWTVQGSMTAVPYGFEDFPSFDVSDAIGGGRLFFAGGPHNAASSITQVVDVSAGAAQIDARQVSATFSALLGGFSDEDDAASGALSFRDGSGNGLGTAALEQITAARRANRTDLLAEDVHAAVPPGTRAIAVTISALRVDGRDLYNDAYFDNVRLELRASGPAPAPTPTPEPQPAPPPVVVTPAPAPAPPVPVVPPKVVSVVLGYGYHAAARSTRFDRFVLEGVPSGATITMTCSRSCTHRRFVKHVAHGGDISLKPMVAKPVRAGTMIKITVSVPGQTAAVKTLRVRSKTRPQVKAQCLPPGATHAVTCR